MVVLPALTVGRRAELVERRGAACAAAPRGTRSRTRHRERSPERQLVGDLAEQEAADGRDDRGDRRVHDEDRPLVVGRRAELDERLEQRTVERERETHRDQRDHRHEDRVVARGPPRVQRGVGHQEQAGAEEADEEDRAEREPLAQPDDRPGDERGTGEERAGEQTEHVRAGVDVVRGGGQDAQHRPGREVEHRGDRERLLQHFGAADDLDPAPHGTVGVVPEVRLTRDPLDGDDDRHVAHGVEREHDPRADRGHDDATRHRARDRHDRGNGAVHRRQLGQPTFGRDHARQLRPRGRDHRGDDPVEDGGDHEHRVGERSGGRDDREAQRDRDLRDVADDLDRSRVAVGRHLSDDRREQEGGQCTGPEHDDREHHRPRLAVRDERHRDRDHRGAERRDREGQDQPVHRPGRA